MEARQPASGKWVARAIYGLLLLVTLSVAWWALGESAPDAPVSEGTPTGPAAPRSPALPSLERERDEPPRLAAVADAPEPAAPSAPSLVALPAVPAPSTPRPPKHPVDADAFARESALIARARGELPSTPEAALKTLAEHQQAFPGGVLKRDADLLHVEALLRLGRRQEAENLGRKLVSRDEGVGRAVERLLRDVPSN